MSSIKSALLRLLLACALFVTAVPSSRCTCEHNPNTVGRHTNSSHQDRDCSCCDCEVIGDQSIASPISKPGKQPSCPVCSFRSSLFVRHCPGIDRSGELNQVAYLEAAFESSVMRFTIDNGAFAEVTSSPSTQTRLNLRI